MLSWNIGYFVTLTIKLSEPEFRLVFMIPACIACGFGMFFFGYTLEVGSPAELCAFLQGVMMVGVLIGIFSTLSYGLDSFRSESNEIFVMNMVFKVSDQSDNATCRLLTLDL